MPHKANLHVPPGEVLKELEEQGFGIRQRGSNHYVIKPPDHSRPAFMVAWTHRAGERDRFNREDWAKMRRNGFVWPPPGKEKTYEQYVETLEVLAPPDGVEREPFLPDDAWNLAEKLNKEEIEKQALELRMVNLGQLQFDDYQRDFNPTNPAVAEPFMISKAGAIHVNERKDGKIFCFDGQHRVKGGIASMVTQLPALYYKGMSKAEEAAAFYVLNDKRKPVKKGDSFRARVEAKDPVATNIVRIVNNHGFKLSYNPNRADGCTDAVAAIERLYRMNVLERTLTTLQTIWHGERDSLNMPVLLGVGSLFVVFGVEIDATRLTQQLKTVAIEKVYRDARKGQYEVGGPLWAHVARVALNHYNHGLGARRLTGWEQPAWPKTEMEERNPGGSSRG